MKKVGPAFSDYVTQNQRIKKRTAWINPFSGIPHFIPLFLLFILFSLLLLRSFYLQVIRSSYYKRLSDNNRVRSGILPAPRGIVFDRKGRPLVRNVASYKKIDKNGKVVSWIDESQALSLLTKGKENDLRIGVQREYLYKDIFSHALGYIGQIDQKEILMPEFKDYQASDFIGKMGLEEKYESILRGIDGKELFEVDTNGKMVHRLGVVEPIAGSDIKTTLDIDIQKAVYEAMKDVKSGAAIVSDPTNGAIFALYSKPAFDTNLFTHSGSYEANGEYKNLESIISDIKNQPFLNRAIGGLYPPGSTYKLVTAATALETKKILPDTKFEDTGILQVGEFSFGNWYYLQYGKKEGLLDIVGAIKRSNDIFFYKAAEAVGVDALFSFSKQFGLGSKLGIDILGERSGVVPNESWKQEHIKDNWYLGDTYHLGIGQGFLLTTPLQVNFWTSVFANGGFLYKPHINQGSVEVLRHDFLKKSTIDLIREGMKQSCSTGGVAWPFFDFKVGNSKLKVDGQDFSDVGVASNGARMVQIPIGCKTGTAETTKDKNPHAWITLFAPFYHPEVVVTVLVENGGEGSSVAGPIAKKILEKYFEGK